MLCMRIINEVKLDFKDVLIIPHRSTLKSRSEVSLDRTFVFKHSQQTWTGIPIIAANMDTVATIPMATELSKHNIITALHKHYTPTDLIDFYTKNDTKHVFYSLGIGQADLDKFDQVKKSIQINQICIDVANGYSETFIDFVKKIREDNPTITIMAGNVVTAEMAEALILAGADIIKTGIGGGCLTADARVLMSNGTYKNIVDVKEGDRVITMNGEPATVRRSFCTGLKSVLSVKHAHFYTPLKLTGDHNCFIGDLNSVTKSTLASSGYKRMLEVPDRFGKTKLKWKPVNELNQDVALLPRCVSWELPGNLSIDMSKYFIRTEHTINYNMTIESTYNTGYMFGFFMGDGCSRKYKGTNKKGFSSFSGGVEWYINYRDQDRVKKLCDAIVSVTGKVPTCSNKGTSYTKVILYSKQWGEFFQQFGKFDKKHLPEEFFCENIDYLRGIYDGLIDSDGHITNDGQITFNNTSPQLMELFGWITFKLFGSFPNMLNGGLRSSYLVTNPRHDGYRSFLAETHPKRQLDDYQIIKILDITKDIDDLVPVYDLEIDHPSHSFIANNMIVHNSVCTTRLVAGVGYPQLSAVIETADAVHGLGGLICSDGGCTTPGDVAKAFGAGADFVMLGGMLAGHDECGGEILGATVQYIGNHKHCPSSNTDDWTYVVTNPMTTCAMAVPSVDLNQLRQMSQLYNNCDMGHPLYQKYKQLFCVTLPEKPMMKFYGMSSKAAMDKHNGGVAEYRASEGKEVLVPYKGPVSDTVQQILGGVRSACTYTGAKTLKELSKRTTFVRVTQTHNTTFGDSSKQ